jgi:AcrR family transcriptional regulator
VVSSRQEQILSTAAPLFARRGFHGVTVDDLGAASGITGPALYRHFRAKEEILAELLLGVSRTLLEGGRRRLAEAPDAAAALDRLVAWHVDFALDNPDVITVQARELPNLPPDARRAVRGLQNGYVRIWAGVISSVSGCDRVAAAHAAFGLMNSTPHSARLPRPAMAALLRTMALSCLRTVPRGTARVS